MPTVLSRQELYDLVWSRPRTALAKEFGVSDVAINKHCVRARVPAPPLGYWAKVSAGGKPPRQKLPTRLPGQANLVVIGLEPQWQGTYKEDFGDAEEPPTFSEDAEVQVAYAVKVIGKVTATKDLKAPDRALARVLGAEARRRERQLASEWSFDKPHFDEPVYQRQLRIFNSLARAFSQAYGRQEVRVEEEWLPNVGTTRHLTLWLDCGAVSMSLGFLEPSFERKNRGRRTVSATTLFVGSEKAHAGVQEWSDVAGSKLESQLTSIVESLLRRAEVSLRAAAQWQYEYGLKIRAQERAAQDAREREAEVKRLAAIEAKRAKVRDEVVEIARRRSVAEDIRATVRAMQAHPESGGSLQARFQAWSEHALEVADHIDPMCSSLESVIGSFEVE